MRSNNIIVHYYDCWNLKYETVICTKCRFGGEFLDYNNLRCYGHENNFTNLRVDNRNLRRINANNHKVNNNRLWVLMYLCRQVIEQFLLSDEHFSNLRIILDNKYCVHTSSTAPSHFIFSLDKIDNT